MDNFIIVILGVIFFIGRIYMNYKKEQEEASKRNPAAPRTAREQPVQQMNRPSERPADGIPKWLEDLFPPIPAQPAPVQPNREPAPVLVKEPSSHRGSITYERVKYIPTELPADLLSEYRNLPDKKEIEELKRSVAIHKAHDHQFKRLDPFLMVDKEDNIEVPTFNLREAIIMKAILERPYS